MTDATRGDMVAVTVRLPGRKPTTVLGLVHRWSGRPDALALVIDGNLKRYRVYIDSVVRVSGHEGIRDEIIAKLATTKRGKRAAATDAPLDPDLIGREPGAGYRHNHATPHDVPYRTTDTADGDLNPNLWRFIGRGYAERRWLKTQRETNPRYWRDVILPNLKGTQPTANVRALLRASTDLAVKGSK